MSETNDAGGCYGVTSSRTMKVYLLSLIAIVLIALTGPLTGNAGELVITVPMAVILILTIFSDKEFVHVPPAMVVIMIATFLLAAVARMLHGEAMQAAAMIMWGVNLGMIGIVCVFMLRGTIDGISVPDSKLVLPVSMCVALAIYVLTAMLQYYVSLFWSDMTPVDLDSLMSDLVFVLLGALAVGLLYMSKYAQSLFGRTVNSFLEENSDKCEVEEKRRRMISELIEGGESTSLEYKSTFAVNVGTDKTDDNIRKASLKTIVAFLNTDGGTLLVGVDDDGKVIGADVHRFDNPDKFLRHFGGEIEKRIGSEYLPYIKYRLVRFPDLEGGSEEEEDGETVINGRKVPYKLPKEKYVLRVTCYRHPQPVFLKFDNTDTFYVRSGASSVVLNGHSLLDYIKNRSRKNRLEIARKDGVRDDE